MNDREPIPLEYSSVAEEQKREEESRRERREALADYNESTFGERHPYRNAFIVAYVIAGLGIAASLIRACFGRGIVSGVSFLILTALGAASIIVCWLRQR